MLEAIMRRLSVQTTFAAVVGFALSCTSHAALAQPLPRPEVSADYNALMRQWIEDALESEWGAGDAAHVSEVPPFTNDQLDELVAPIHCPEFSRSIFLMSWRMKLKSVRTIKK
jgi:hypothetical protein